MTWLIDKIEKFLPSVKFIVRAALIVATSTILISCILVLLLGKITKESYGELPLTAIWYSALFSLWTLICSILILLCIAVYKALTKDNVWESIKSETVLLSLTILSAMVFYIIHQII